MSSRLTLVKKGYAYSVKLLAQDHKIHSLIECVWPTSHTFIGKVPLTACCWNTFGSTRQFVNANVFQSTFYFLPLICVLLFTYSNTQWLWGSQAMWQGRPVLKQTNIASQARFTLSFPVHCPISPHNLGLNSRSWRSAGVKDTQSSYSSSLLLKWNIHSILIVEFSHVYSIILGCQFVPLFLLINISEIDLNVCFWIRIITTNIQ